MHIILILFHAQFKFKQLQSLSFWNSHFINVYRTKEMAGAFVALTGIDFGI